MLNPWEPWDTRDDWARQAFMEAWAQTIVDGWKPAREEETLLSVGRQQIDPNRIRRYLDSMPESVSGEAGHTKLFKAAKVLVHGFGLTPDEAFPFLASFNQRCQPPWNEHQLRYKLSQALKCRDSRPRGYLLESGVTISRVGKRIKMTIPKWVWERTIQAIQNKQ